MVPSRGGFFRSGAQSGRRGVWTGAGAAVQAQGGCHGRNTTTATAQTLSAAIHHVDSVFGTPRTAVLPRSTAGTLLFHLRQAPGAQTVTCMNGGCGGGAPLRILPTHKSVRSLIFSIRPSNSFLSELMALSSYTTFTALHRHTPPHQVLHHRTTARHEAVSTPGHSWLSVIDTGQRRFCSFCCGTDHAHARLMRARQCGWGRRSTLDLLSADGARELAAHDVLHLDLLLQRSIHLQPPRCGVVTRITHHTADAPCLSPSASEARAGAQHSRTVKAPLIG